MLVCVHSPISDAVTGLVPQKVGLGATDEQSLPAVNQAARAFSRSVGQGWEGGAGLEMRSWEDNAEAENSAAKDEEVTRVVGGFLPWKERVKGFQAKPLETHLPLVQT